jgi:hypothetical protein
MSRDFQEPPLLDSFPLSEVPFVSELISIGGRVNTATLEPLLYKATVYLHAPTLHLRAPGNRGCFCPLLWREVRQAPLVIYLAQQHYD